MYSIDNIDFLASEIRNIVSYLIIVCPAGVLRRVSDNMFKVTIRCLDQAFPNSNGV